MTKPPLETHLHGGHVMDFTPTKHYSSLFIFTTEQEARAFINKVSARAGSYASQEMLPLTNVYHTAAAGGFFAEHVVD